MGPDRLQNRGGIEVEGTLAAADEDDLAVDDRHHRFVFGGHHSAEVGAEQRGQVWMGGPGRVSLRGSDVAELVGPLLQLRVHPPIQVAVGQREAHSTRQDQPCDHKAQHHGQHATAHGRGALRSAVEHHPLVHGQKNAEGSTIPAGADRFRRPRATLGWRGCRASPVRCRTCALRSYRPGPLDGPPVVSQPSAPSRRCRRPRWSAG